MLPGSLWQIVKAFLDMLLPAMAFLLCAGLILQYGLRCLYGYNISRNGLEFKVFRLLVVKTIPFKEIVSAEVLPPVKVFPWTSFKMFFALRLGNRIWGDFVLIERDRGIFRRIILTPENGSEFIDSIRTSREVGAS